MSLVSVRGLRKAYGEHTVLDDVNLDVAEGSVTVLIGPSGSGKTTLLRCLNGLEKPQAGLVQVNGISLDFAARPSREQIAGLRAQSGMVFQAHNLFPHRTALENLTEGPIHAHREPKEQARARALAAKPAKCFIEGFPYWSLEKHWALALRVGGESWRGVISARL